MVRCNETCQCQPENDQVVCSCTREVSTLSLVNSDHSFSRSILKGYCFPYHYRFYSTTTIIFTFASSFPVTDKLVEPILDGDTLESLIQEKRLFIADFAVMEGISTVKVCDKPLKVTQTTESRTVVVIISWSLHRGLIDLQRAPIKMEKEELSSP